MTDDVEHILRRYFPDRRLAEIRVLSKPTRLEPQKIIMTEGDDDSPQE